MVASVWVSPRTSTPSFASTAWCSPSLHRRPAICRPVNSSTITTLPSSAMMYFSSFWKSV